MSEGQLNRRLGRVPFRERPSWTPRVRRAPPMPNGDTSQQVKDFLAYLWEGQEDQAGSLKTIENKLDKVIELLEDTAAWRAEIERLRRRAPWWIISGLTFVLTGMGGIGVTVLLQRLGGA